jgi:putative ATPase
VNSINIPLAERMRPKYFREVIGQEHLVGEQGALKIAIQNKVLPSIILWGNPGIGKTTLAQVIAAEVQLPFFALSAINAGVKDVREVIQKAESAGRAILFIDEIHRFTKNQQDALLGAIERGPIILIGATTENPSFEVNNALLSRCQVYTLNPLSKSELEKLLHRAIQEDVVLREKEIELKETEALLYFSGGDARKLLNLLELVAGVFATQKVVVTNEIVKRQAQKKTAHYDQSGDLHYDIISAFIKSIRGSDPNAALFYLARMIKSGEDVKFIARRLLILASEDIGLANPTALVMATSCFQAVQMIGYPESDLILSQTVIYLASSPKSNSATEAIHKAYELAEKYADAPVPIAIRNAPTQLMKELNYGADYKYAHAYEGNFVDMEFLPEEVKGKRIYTPQNNAKENEIRSILRKWWKKYGY